MENPKTLYSKILGLEKPWFVREVELNHENGKLVVSVAHRGACLCPECGKSASRYDHRTRRWRHLDTCQYQTIIEAKVPRTECAECGVHQLPVPWAERNSRFTVLFEALVVEWLHDASIEAVRRHFGLSWNAVDGIMRRAVRRGLARKEPLPLQRIGVDETSYSKGHQYLTVVTDLDSSTVEFVGEGRGRETLESYYTSLPKEHLESIQAVGMDMWKPFMNATRTHVPDADSKICFDKFHVAQHLGDAIDKVRRQEQRGLLKEGREILKGSRFLWLQNPENMDADRWRRFSGLRQANLKTARAWAIRQEAMGLWGYRVRGWGRKAWMRWYGWAIRSRLEPVKKVARMVKTHLEGILNAIVHRVTNAGAESMNSRIQELKRRARGYRNTERMKNAIYFHFGGLDMSPATHTI
jgi:transposase